MENSTNTNIANFVNKLEKITEGFENNSICGGFKTTGDFGNNAICGGFHNTLVDDKLTIPQKSDPVNFN
jgi:hypothetical protein